eukprot:TRINITY_DN6108_c1_g1_i1.p1 TRINITY_DN6108_c1_g1~~TRINITY_DN6108_c1_g1_i1.p1  ORF type:complete len:226 (-),score=79.13 TRINITY_DN6108_c1_g1_i1:195-872(-)
MAEIVDSPPIKKQRVEDAPEMQIQDLIAQLRAADEKHAALSTSYNDLKKRESALVMRLSTKEQEIHELQSQVSDLKQSISVSGNQQMRQTLLDPAVNLLIMKMKEELEQTQKKLAEAQEELQAVQFNPQSITGKKLVGRCKLLLQENEDLGTQLAEGKTHALENELALQKQVTDELKQSLQESNTFVTQLDDEVEAMQNELLQLKQQLKAYEQQQQPPSLKQQQL